MLTSPLFRPLSSPLATALTAARVAGGGVAAVTWDQIEKSTAVILSNGDLTGTVTDGVDYYHARSSAGVSSGKYVIELTMVYPGPDVNAEAAAGLCTSSFDATIDGDHLGVDANTCTITCVGDVYAPPSGVVSGFTTVASGGKRRIYVNATTRKYWFGNGSSVDGDPEAGTGEAGTLGGAGAIYFAVQMWSSASPSPTSATITAGFSSGTFAAWPAS